MRGILLAHITRSPECPWTKWAKHTFKDWCLSLNSAFLCPVFLPGRPCSGARRNSSPRPPSHRPSKPTQGAKAFLFVSAKVPRPTHIRLMPPPQIHQEDGAHWLASPGPGDSLWSRCECEGGSSSLHLGLDRMAQDKCLSPSEGPCTPWVFQDPKTSQVRSKTWANHGLLLLFSRSALSGSLWPHGLQHLRLPCPSLSPGVCSNSCPSSRWCHPTISFSFDLSQHQGLFQWVGSLHQVAKILQLQHQH